MIAEDYQAIWYTYLPPGLLWPEQEGDSPFWDMYAEAQAQEWARVDDDALEIIKEAIPDGVNYPDDLLEYWERVCDLDPSGYTDAERRENLVSRLRGPGSPTKKKFSEQIDPITELNAILDGWQVVNSIDSSWSTIGSGTVDVDAEGGPDGEQTAELITMPAATDGAEIDILRMANYEAMSVSFKARAITLTDFSVDITVVGRDGADKYTDTFTFTNAWKHYTISVADIGTGGSDPKLQIELNTGTNEILAIDNVEAGFRRRYFEQFSAGSGAGEPVGAGWEFVWGVEYGDDLTDRDVGGNPDWVVASGSGTITDNNVQEPISRDQLGDTLINTSGVSIFTVDCSNIPSTADQVRVSLWIKCTLIAPTTSLTITIRYYNRAGTYTALYTAGIVEDTDWYKIEGVVDLGIGGSTPYLYVFAVPSGGQANVDTAHVRVSAVRESLEDEIEGGTPLHTQPVFLSYGELSSVGE